MDTTVNDFAKRLQMTYIQEMEGLMHQIVRAAGGPAPGPEWAARVTSRGQNNMVIIALDGADLMAFGAPAMETNRRGGIIEIHVQQPCKIAQAKKGAA